MFAVLFIVIELIMEGLGSEASNRVRRLVAAISCSQKLSTPIAVYPARTAHQILHLSYSASVGATLNLDYVFRNLCKLVDEALAVHFV